MIDDANERLCNPVSRGELERRWKAVRAQMAAQGYDALVFQGAGNSGGTAGYYRWITGISALNAYQQTVVFPAEGLMTICCHGPIGGEFAHDGCDPSYPGIGRRLTTAAFPGVNYNSGYDADLISGDLAKRGCRKVGYVGANSLYFGFGLRMIEQLAMAGIQFLDATALVDPIKAIKSPEEIELMRRGAAMQDEIMRKGIEFIKPGMKDFEVMAYGQYLGELMGAETGYFLGSSAAPGEPALMRRRAEQNRTIRKGDVFKFQVEDTGPGGMFVHLGRNIVLGKAPQELVDAVGIVLELREFTLKLLKPGRSCPEIFAEYNAELVRRGLRPEKRLHCHNQGYDVVEPPMIRHDETLPLLAPLNIGLHPSILTPRFLATICDNYLLNADGSIERLHQVPEKIFELEV